MEQQSNGIPLQGKSVVVYDLEIKECIGENGITWNSHDRMGISVGVSFDYRTGDFRTFFDDNMGELVDQLHSAELVVGFNHIGFDNKLLRSSGYPLKPDSELVQYDILAESRKSIGQQFAKGLKLDDHLDGIFGPHMKKTGHGELSPKQYQAKQWGPLVSYCIADVRRTCLVFEHIWREQFVITPTWGKKFVSDPRLLVKSVL
jgi:DEAD/DEAH box helicase domain-containing protein